ncbi:MAG: hypothetical protein KGJ80_14110, partial [Chloroflexota bacterium]|nr:hypothetical protein [Chloroflexota bacterium]
MQDRYYIIAIVVILAICCLGGYVAVSGYLNSNPSSISLLTPASAATLHVLVVPTDPPAPTKPAAMVVGTPSVAAVPSPLGAFQTIAASTTQVPVTVAIATPPSTSAPTASAQSCAGYAFCPKSGPGDASIAPTAVDCPRNYVWGRIVDVSGNGLPGMRIRFKGPLGDLDTVVAKAKSPSDQPGRFDILAPSGTFTLWVLDSSGAQASPQIQITMQQPYSGSGNCPTRVD